MDLRLVASTFVAVFLAELGDKTQLAALTLASGSHSRWSVFVGASLALVASTLLAVLLADALASRVDLRVTRGLAGVVLLAMGALYLVAAIRNA